MLSGIITFFPSVGFLSLQTGMCEHGCLPVLCELRGLFSLQHPCVSPLLRLMKFPSAFFNQRFIKTPNRS